MFILRKKKQLPAYLKLLLCWFARLVGTQQWTIMETHSNKTSYKLTVLKPDTTYQVKILTQCLSKLHKTNEVITVRTPEGCEYFGRPSLDLP